MHLFKSVLSFLIAMVFLTTTIYSQAGFSETIKKRNQQASPGARMIVVDIKDLDKVINQLGPGYKIEPFLEALEDDPANFWVAQTSSNQSQKFEEENVSGFKKIDKDPPEELNRQPSTTPASNLNQTETNRKTNIKSQPVSSKNKAREPKPPSELTVPPGMGIDIIHSTARFTRFSNVSDMEDLVVIVVVAAGFYFTALLAVYSVKYAYDLAVADDYRWFWWETGLIVNTISSDSESGNLTGFKINTGYTNPKNPFGLTIETGVIDSTFQLQEGGEQISVKGNYFGVGPALRLVLGDGQNPSYLSAELLLGTTEHKEVGLLGMARALFNYGISEHGRLGLGFGTVYLNLKRSRGFVRKENDFNPTFSLEGSYRF